MQRSALLKSRLEIVLIYKTTIFFLCAPPNVHKRLETKTPSPLQFQRKPVFASIAAFFLNDIPEPECKPWQPVVLCQLLHFVRGRLMMHICRVRAAFECQLHYVQLILQKLDPS